MNISTKLLSTTLIAGVILAGCGGGSSDSKQDTNNEGADSNIPYLQQNHANYKLDGSNITPAPVKDANKRSIDWTIEASDEEGAKKLADHIRYMESQLLADQNPRAFDKLFLMETYMKFNKFYTTSVEQSGKSVVVSKIANNRCAYRVISAHSDAVSNDFFAQGNISTDYSSTADSILNSSDCNSQKTDIESYIAKRKRRR